MGLFQKATSIVPGQGLLQKSLQMIVEKKTELPPYLTQEEIDLLLKKSRKRPSTVLKRTENPVPANVPRTWSEAGMTPPPMRGPMIDKEEFSKNGVKTAKGAKRASSAADPTDDIISAVFAVPQSVEHPSQAFVVLKERLSITKGSLLLYDPVRMVYAPWADIGYDETTLHRLRIPLGASESFNAAANGRPIVVSGAAELSHYAAYFSNREFSLVSWLILVPFIYGEKLVAILMVSAANPPYPSQDAFLMGLERIAGAASPAFQKAREERLRGAEEGEEQRPKTLEEELTRLISSRSAAERKILFFSLSLEALEKKVLSLIPLLDSFRLEEDVTYFLRCFTSDTGRAISIGQGKYLFAAYGLAKRDVDLFIHQLKIYLSGLFGSLDGVLDTVSVSNIKKIHSFPDDGDEASHLVSLFSS
jgi:hypothetical protein